MRSKRQFWFGFLLAVAVALGSSPANADCVAHAQNRDRIEVLDRHTLLLSGRLGPDILVRTFATIKRRSTITIVRNSFCSFATDVLIVDGNLIGVGRVTALR